MAESCQCFDILTHDFKSHLIYGGFLAAFKMGDAWEHDSELKEDLEKYVLQGIQRKEILDFMYRDYPHYTWSLRSLDRRLRYFKIYYIDNCITLQEVHNAVKEELDGPGRQLGYRAMRQKIRQKHLIKVSRDKVYDVMFDLAPEQLEERQLGIKGIVR